MTNVWFTADLHIGHRLVAGLRGFDNTDDHDNTLADNWDTLISPVDTVWVLGDISAGGKNAQEAALEWLSSRPGQKHLIAGNHDSTHPMHRDSHKWVGKYNFVFNSVASAARRKHDGKYFLLSHFPYVGDHVEVQRYDQWRLPDYGVPILHGHTHSGETFSTSLDGTPQIHVGVDAWGLKPVQLSQIGVLLNEC